MSASESKCPCWILQNWAHGIMLVGILYQFHVFDLNHSSLRLILACPHLTNCLGSKYDKVIDGFSQLKVIDNYVKPIALFGVDH